MRRLLAPVLCLLACGGLPIEPDDGGIPLPPERDAGPQPEEDAGTDGGDVPDAGEVDAGIPDAGAPDAGLPDAGPMSSGPVIYPWGLTQSPLTASVAANLRAIAAKSAAQKPAVFSKIGDSNTVNTNFFSCFAGAQVDLAGRAQLQPTVDFFKAGMAGTTTPFNRVSQCATVGWSAPAALAGTPSPLTTELNTVDPRFGLVMFGTNDIQSRDVFTYGRAMFAIADQLIATGVVPIFSAVIPRDDNADADLWVPRYNAIVRGIAQARQFPFVDLDRELRLIPNHGIGSDGLHLNVYTSGGARGCVFTPAGLQFGHNTRNLLTLEALHRAKSALDSAPAPDATAPTRQGSGSLTDPFVVDSIPFVDVRDTRLSGTNVASTYPACSTANEGGPELYYRFTLTQRATVRAFVVSLGSADIDVHLLDGAGACLARDDKQLVRTLEPGTYTLSLDTYVSGGTAQRGEYLLSVSLD